MEELTGPAPDTSGWVAGVTWPGFTKVTRRSPPASPPITSSQSLVDGTPISIPATGICSEAAGAGTAVPSSDFIWLSADATVQSKHKALQGAADCPGHPPIQPRQTGGNSVCGLETPKSTPSTGTPNGACYQMHTRTPPFFNAWPCQQNRQTVGHYDLEPWVLVALPEELLWTPSETGTSFALRRCRRVTTLLRLRFLCFAATGSSPGSATKPFTLSPTLSTAWISYPQSSVHS
jgi:hypothetical protein